MGTRCCVKQCDDLQIKDDRSITSLYGFPKEVDVALVWADFCGHESGWMPGKASRICSRHFARESFSDARKRFLNPKTVPSVCAPWQTASEWKEGKWIPRMGDVIKVVILDKISKGLFAACVPSDVVIRQTPNVFTMLRLGKIPMMVPVFFLELSANTVSPTEAVQRLLSGLRIMEPEDPALLNFRSAECLAAPAFSDASVVRLSTVAAIDLSDTSADEDETETPVAGRVVSWNSSTPGVVFAGAPRGHRLIAVPPQVFDNDVPSKPASLPKKNTKKASSSLYRRCMSFRYSENHRIPERDRLLEYSIRRAITFAHAEPLFKSDQRKQGESLAGKLKCRDAQIDKLKSKLADYEKRIKAQELVDISSVSPILREMVRRSFMAKCAPNTYSAEMRSFASALYQTNRKAYILLKDNGLPLHNTKLTLKEIEMERSLISENTPFRHENLLLSEQQVAALEGCYSQNTTPSPEQIRELAEDLMLTIGKVRKWFVARRAKDTMDQKYQFWQNQKNMLLEAEPFDAVAPMETS